MNQRVIVLGGYGVFGSRIAKSLARHPELDVIVAGRNTAAADGAAVVVDERAKALRVDLNQPDAMDKLMGAAPKAVVDAVGPFQSRDLQLARCCVAAGVHYIDIADDRLRVDSINSLDAAAKRANVLVVSGASTVPAISTAIVDDLASDPATIVEIHVGISPGHRAPRGLATVSAILGYSGKAIPSFCGGSLEFGWGDLQRYRYPAPVGARWLSNVDTPERALWRERYPSLERASMRAGLELDTLHLGLSLLSRGVRAGLISSLAHHAKALLDVANALDRLGTDAGAMHVQVVSRDSHGTMTSRTGTLVATNGDGPQIPSTPAALLAKKLLGVPGYVSLALRGAQPCMDLMSREEILAELSGYAIRYLVDD